MVAGAVTGYWSPMLLFFFFNIIIVLSCHRRRRRRSCMSSICVLALGTEKYIPEWQRRDYSLFGRLSGWHWGQRTMNVNPVSGIERTRATRKLPSSQNGYFFIGKRHCGPVIKSSVDKAPIHEI